MIALKEFWVVRVKGTNLYLPAGRPGVAASTTAREPEEYGGKYGPRLYPSRRAAAISLSYWLKGPMGEPLKETTQEDWNGEFPLSAKPQYTSRDLVPRPDLALTPRLASKMEIILGHFVIGELS